MENIKISPGLYSKNILNTLSSNKIIEKVCVPSIGTPSSNKIIEKVCSPVSILNALNSNKNIEKVCAPVTILNTLTSNKNIEKMCAPVTILNTLTSNKNIEKMCVPNCTPVSNFTEAGQENISKLGKIKSDQDLSIILKQFKQEILMYIGKKIDILHDDIILHNKHLNR